VIPLYDGENLYSGLIEPLSYISALIIHRQIGITPPDQIITARLPLLLCARKTVKLVLN